MRTALANRPESSEVGGTEQGPKGTKIEATLERDPFSTAGST